MVFNHLVQSYTHDLLKPIDLSLPYVRTGPIEQSIPQKKITKEVSKEKKKEQEEQKQ